MNYTYDPRKIRDGGKDQMRFELGDTAVEQGALGCALSDEEYETFLLDLVQGKKPWLVAKISLVKVVLHKFAFQVDTKIDVLEYDFSSRVAHWEKLLAILEKELNSCAVPVLTGGKSPPYFIPDMMNNKSPLYGKRKRW